MTEPATNKPNRWGIVGGGMLGLALAQRLAAAGQHVEVLESAPEIGGLASAWQVGDVTWDRYYHVTLLSDARLGALLKDLGLDDEIEWIETRTGFYTDGQLYSMSNSVEFLRFPPLGLLDKCRLGATIFAASRIKNWKRLEHILVGDWLQRWSGERTFRKIWQPLLQAKLGPCYRRASAAFIWATIQRMYAARHSGLKKEMFGYVRGGYARVMERFGESLRDSGVDLRTGVRVNRVTSQLDGQVLVETNRGGRWYDRVVLTTPSPVVLQTCSQLGDDERSRHEKIEYLGVICASVVLDRPLAGYYVTNITDPGLPYTAVIEMTSLVAPSQLQNNHLVYLPRYAASDDEAWSWSDHEIEERFLEALERMYPAFHRDHVRAFRISRAKHVMALPTLGYSENLPPMRSAAANVFVVNSAHIVKGTLNVNEVLTLADEAFEQVLQAALEPAGSESATWQLRGEPRFTSELVPPDSNLMSLTAASAPAGEIDSPNAATTRHDESTGELIARP